MNIGKLRHRITIQKVTLLPDGGGGVRETWQDFVTSWASIEPLRGNEYYKAQQVQSEVSHKITMRYRKGIMPQMRVVYKDRIFKIEAVMDIEERHVALELLCLEVVS